MSRQIALADIGAEGQGRFAAAEAAVCGSDLAADTAATYLAAAGVGRIRRIVAPPATGAAWLDALRGASIVVRQGFDDDPMLRAAVRLGIPAVVMRAADGQIDVIAFRRQGPCPHADLEIPVRASERGEGGAAAVVAGTLAATEALWVLALPAEGPRARHLRLSLASVGDPVAQEMPWAPECFACGGGGRVAVLS